MQATQYVRIIVQYSQRTRWASVTLRRSENLDKSSLEHLPDYWRTNMISRFNPDGYQSAQKSASFLLHTLQQDGFEAMEISGKGGYYCPLPSPFVDDTPRNSQDGITAFARLKRLVELEDNSNSD